MNIIVEIYFCFFMRSFVNSYLDISFIASFAWVFVVVVVVVAFVGSEGVAANANEDRRNDLFRE